MRDIIYNELVKVYARFYSYDLCEALAEHIADKMNSGEFKTTKDIMLYVWMNTSGGTTAEYAAEQIQKALPHLIEDSDKRTR